MFSTYLTFQERTGDADLIQASVGLIDSRNACQMAGSSSVQGRAGPVGLQAEQVERADNVHVVQAGLGQAAVAARRAPWLVAWCMVPSTPARGESAWKSMFFSAARAAAWPGPGRGAAG